MKSKEQQELRELLTKLLQFVYSICIESLTKKRFEPEKQLYFRQKVTGFSYDDTGTHIFNWKPVEIVKDNWYKAVNAIEKETKKLSLYSDALERITHIYENKWKPPDDYSLSLDDVLSGLINVITRGIFAGEITEESSLESYIESFLKHLNLEGVGYRLTAELSGIVLKPPSIQLDENTLLRRPKLEDIEEKHRAQDFFMADEKSFRLPTAIMELTEASASSLRRIDLLDEKVYRAVAILRLFRFGGIEYIKYTIDAESLFIPGIYSCEGINLTKSGSYLIKNEDVKPLKLFWSKMKRATLPSSVYVGKRKKPDELSIAYDRYSDSLEREIIEKRISSAVMGLEALYLSPSEQQEMSFRLRMRLGKMLSLIGYNPEEVRKNMIDAYDIRSTYVHGGTLKQKSRQKYENKHGNLNEFCETITDYLRSSIVALLLRKTSKASIIQKIDDSFLDSTREEEIKTLLFMPYR